MGGRTGAHQTGAPPRAAGAKRSDDHRAGVNVSPKSPLPGLTCSRSPTGASESRLMDIAAVGLAETQITGTIVLQQVLPAVLAARSDRPARRCR